MKIGIEVEGRLKGIQTFFIDNTEIDRFHKHLDYYHKKYNVAQVYVSYPDDIANPKLKDIADKWFVTVEVDKIPTEIPEYINQIMLCVRHEDITKLRPQDSFKIDTKNQNLFCASVETAFRTYPKDFQNDKEVKLYD